MIKVAITALSAMLLVSCEQKALTLPQDPIDRAATCGVVAAAEARLATDIKEVLPFEAQGRILHHTLIAASQSGSFSGETAGVVSVRMKELEGAITGGEWRALVPACQAAFPETMKTEVTLPSNRFEAQLGCNELADFMLTAMAEQESDYGNELAEYRKLKRDLENPLVPGLRSRAGTNIQAQQAERHKALAGFAKLGAPVAVMKACIARFG